MSGKLFYLFVVLFGLSLVSSCNSETSMLPKPRAYPKVNYPAGELEAFSLEVCPFTFEKPSYVKVEKDTSYFDEAPRHPCWFDLVTPNLNGRIHMSYLPVADRKSFEGFRDDAFDLAGKHNVVASYIEEVPINRADANVHGFAFDLEGNVASPFQFYVSDSANHFLRGSLYVNAQASADSLAPIYSFLRADALKVVNSIRWAEN